LAILINTLSMGIEHHNQPEELTSIVESINIVFSGIFALEMLLKVIAEGPFRYISNGFNVFDGIIVILRYFSAALYQLIYHHFALVIPSLFLVSSNSARHS
jgi:hypothetical protein